MVKTRSAARVGAVGSSSTSGASSSSSGSELRARLHENGHRARALLHAPHRSSQSGSGGGGSGGGGGGGGGGQQPPAPPKDPLGSARSLYAAPYVGDGRQQAQAQAAAQAQAQAQAAAVAQAQAQAQRAGVYAASYGGVYGVGVGVGVGGVGVGVGVGGGAQLPPYPIHPDVRLKRLPFYDVLGELMKPSSLVPLSAQRMQESSFYFHLTPQQATDIASGRDIVPPANKLDYVVQVQLRFCLLETSCEQEDAFPPGVSVKVNGKLCPLPNPVPTNKPGVEPKRPPRPVNVTALVKLSPTVANTVQVAWSAEYARPYCLAAYLVRKLTAAELLQRLRNKGTKNADYTRATIKEKLSEDYDSEIATTSLRVSLVCPLGKMRMQSPCRPHGCPHLQCFDAALFLMMNERKPTWLCPVCDRQAPYDHLTIDGYFADVLGSARLPPDCTEVQLLPDGSWLPQGPPAPPAAAPTTTPAPAPPTHRQHSVTILNDDVEVIPVEGGGGDSKSGVAGAAAGAGGAGGAGGEVLVDLTSDSEDELPLKRKVPRLEGAGAGAGAGAGGVGGAAGGEAGAGGDGVSSSGYRSPAPQTVISLDSPSPPPSPSRSPSPPPAPSVAGGSPPPLPPPAPAPLPSVPALTITPLPLPLPLPVSVSPPPPLSVSVSVPVPVPVPASTTTPGSAPVSPLLPPPHSTL